MHLTSSALPRLHALFSAPSLTGEVLSRAAKDSDAAFAAFHCGTIAELSLNGAPQSMVVSIQELDDRSRITGFVKAVCHGFDPGTPQLYLEMAHLDHWTHLDNVMPGTVVSNTDHMAMEAWERTEFFQKFRHRIGSRQTAIVHFEIPDVHGRILKFLYDSGEGRLLTPGLSKDDIEFASVPFMVCWMMRCDFIDEATARRWLSMLSGLSPTQLFFLRDLANSTGYDPAVSAARIGLTRDDLLRQMAAAPQLVFQSADRLGPKDMDAERMAALAQGFSFLQMTGRPVTRAQLDLVAHPFKRH
ncbi:MAG: hypothetical protein AAF666_18800 [Pseudomonadota bacterium]